MKKLLPLMLVFALFLTACASDPTPAAETVSTLTVTDGDTAQSFTLEELQALASTEATFGETTYVGVSLVTLLDAAGIAPDDLTAVKAVAADGFSANYDATLYMREDVIVAYGQADGDLTTDDGTFRMVLPGEEGRMNVRMLAEIEVIR